MEEGNIPRSNGHLPKHFPQGIIFLKVCVMSVMCMNDGRVSRHQWYTVRDLNEYNSVPSRNNSEEESS